MTDMSKAFPSKYLNKEDLSNKAWPVTISHVKFENVAPEDKPQETKPVLYFTGAERGLVLNITNNNALILMLGKDDSMWANQQIELFNDLNVMYQGKPGGIRIRGVSTPAVTPAGPLPAPAPAHPAVGAAQAAFPGAEVVPGTPERREDADLDVPWC